MIPYAGFDPSEDAPHRRYGNVKSRRPNTLAVGTTDLREKLNTLGRNRSRAVEAYGLFSAGKDTADIAAQLGQPEHVVLKWVSVVRSAKRDLSSPYEVAL